MKWRQCFYIIVPAASMMIGAAADAAALRVCADPNNLPFSDQAGRGFENKIVGLIASDLGSTVDYTWWAQRRGYVRHTLKADMCDVWPGVASGAEMMTSTRPYYRSSYVFVTRADRALHIASFDDPQLRNLIIGVQMVGSDAMNTPPAHALARRGIVQNVRGYMLYGDYRQPHPPSAIIDAVEDGDVDVAVVWGPMAGYFAAQGSTSSRSSLRATVRNCRWRSISRWGFAAATMRCCNSSMIHSRKTTLPSRRSSPIITCPFYQTPLRRAEAGRNSSDQYA